MRKCFLLVAFMLLGGMMSRAQDFTAPVVEFTTLVVEFTDGTSVGYSLYSAPDISVEDKDGKQILRFYLKYGSWDANSNSNYSAVDFEYDKSTVRKLYFQPYDATAIENVDADDEKELNIVFVDNQTVHVNGLKPTDDVRVFNIEGKQVLAADRMGETKCEVSLGSQPKGVYVIKVNAKHSFKVLKR